MSSSKPAARRAQDRRKASPKFNEQLVTWLYQIHNDPELPPSTLAVALEIAWPMSSIGQCSWPSLETIARNCGLSKRSAVRLVQQLVALGHLLAEGGSAGRGHSTRYRLNIIGAEPKAAWDAQAAAPMNLKGFVAHLLEPETGSLKGTVAHLNKERKKVSKKERKQDSGPTGRAISDRVFPTSARDVTETSVASPPSPVNTTDIAAASIPETKRDSAFAGRLVPSEIDQSKIERPVPVASSFLATRRAPEIGNGHDAAGRHPANPPPQEITMMNSPTRKRALETLKRCYPQDRIGDAEDGDLLDALDLGLGYYQLDALVADAIEVNVAANRGEPVPELIEFLVDHVGIVTRLAA